MLSRVADSLYWMSRYFERADHCARVLEANYNLMLDPSRPSTELRWNKITASLGITSESDGVDPQATVARLTSELDNRFSIVACITGAGFLTDAALRYAFNKRTAFALRIRGRTSSLIGSFANSSSHLSGVMRG